jgi:hypothetical protein
MVVSLGLSVREGLKASVASVVRPSGYGLNSTLDSIKP